MSQDKHSEILDFLQTLSHMEGLSPEDLKEMATYLAVDGDVDVQALLGEVHPDGEQAAEDAKILSEKENLKEEEITDLRTLISKANLPGKVKLAMFGNATCRAILITSGNKLIQLCVLKNPKIQEREIEAYSKNPNISGAVLRAISGNRQWIRSYEIKKNLVCNPKTPQDISLKWMRFLHESEIKSISRSKNIPGAVVTQARKIVQAEEMRKSGGKH